ncbi:hypothetical protein EYC80_003543 [Monilinia laxa]|uniref:Structure-specific endonuclease subunit SLX4 n=1 Tax=Monilinia laxa TaxID=61186 RepID=A0A5N6KK10_MONLA|nr:hypothetical protein EYC80_003543 [Monilinia laxa]
MPTTDVYIISSSPPRQLASYNISSPLLPSLDEMFKEKRAPNLQKGSGLAPIATGATTTFSSAATLLRKSSFGSLQGIDTTRSLKKTAVQDEKEPKKSAKSKAPRKAPTKKDDPSTEKVAKVPRKSAKKEGRRGSWKAKKGDDTEGDSKRVADTIALGTIELAAEKKTSQPRAKKGDDSTEEIVKEKAPRKSRAKKMDVENENEVVPKEKAVRKPRAKKSDGDTNVQSKMARGKVTKTANDPNTGKVEKSKADTVSKHFSVNPTVEDIVAEEGFGLVEAIKRRKNWTPPKPTKVPIGPEDDLTDDESDTDNQGFADLLGSFGFSSNEANSNEKDISSRVFTGEATTRKRKLIEMVTTNIPTTATKVIEKAVKKKARTLTDLATSAYAKEKNNDGTNLDASAPLLQYFPQASSGGSTNEGFKIPPKPRSKSPVKGLPKSKKGSADEPILLSPESALKQVGNQDFVFGTSSQLAREDSPSLLRDLHDAMQASNQLDDYDDPFFSPPSKITKRAKDVIAAKRNLWSVAARNDHGDLMDIEAIELAHTPVAKPQDRIIISQNPSSSWITPAKDEWLDIDEIEEDRPPSTQVPTRQMGPIERSINLQLLNSPPQSMNSLRGASLSSPKRKGAKQAGAKGTTSKKAEASKMPNYESYTTPQLSKEISKYNFKPIRSRKRMIDLLTQCYESQNRPALGVLQGNVTITTQKPLETSKDVANASTQVDDSIVSPQRSRGRPKKSDTATISTSKPRSKVKSKITDTVAFLEMDSDAPLSEIRTPKKSKKGKQPLEDVSDSDPSTPSPPRRSSSQIRKASKALELSPADIDQNDEARQVQLFSHISTAVTSAPPSQDPSSPSWQEKILLYDPIVLEDLTSWLNTGALSKVGWDEEVVPKEVKKWCESKSICCLWKENQGGGARSRY